MKVTVNLQTTLHIIMWGYFYDLPYVTHSTNGSKVTPSIRKLHKIFGLPPYCCFTFCKNITPPTVMYFYKVYYQDLKVNGASVTSR